MRKGAVFCETSIDKAIHIEISFASAPKHWNVDKSEWRAELNELIPCEVGNSSLGVHLGHAVDKKFSCPLRQSVGVVLLNRLAALCPSDKLAIDDKSLRY